MVELLAGMAKFSPTLWNVVSTPLKAKADLQDVNLSVGNESTSDLPWCECGQCREMRKEEERVCCKNTWKNHEHPLFENHILTEHNLELAMQSNADFLAYPFDPSNNACWRFIAYRQYILWVWGKLGRRNRRVVPSCIFWKIRDRYPDQNGNYTGFLDFDFQL